MMTMSIIYSDASLQRLHSTISINFVEPIPRRKARMDTSLNVHVKKHGTRSGARYIFTSRNKSVEIHLLHLDVMARILP